MRIIVPRKPCFLFLCLFLLLSRASAQIHPLVLPGTGYVYISASSTSICAGNSVTFTVTGTTDGGASPEFQWYVNGSDVAGGSTFTTSTLTNGASVHCVMYSSQSGISPATSSTITITVNPASAPSVSIAATATTICAGSSVTFTATPVNGGSTPSYQWQLNGGNISGATASTYTSTGISNGQVITCLMTSSSSCVTTPTATSNGITMTVNAIQSFSPAITASLPFCQGSNASFNCNPGSIPGNLTYQWKRNGANVSSSVTGPPAYVLVISTYSAGDVITCVVTTDAACYTPSETSNSLTITTTTPQTFTAGAGPSGGITFCQGAAVTLVATGSQPVTSYQWSQNGSAISGATGSTYVTTATSVAQLQSYSVLLTTGGGCLSNTSATGSTATVPFTITPTVGIPSSPSGPTTRCEGSGTGAYTTSATNVTGYNWSITPSSAGTISGTSTTGTVTWSATFSGTAVVSVTASGCNGPSAAASTNVTVGPAVQSMTLSITGTLPVCTNGATSFIANVGNAGTGTLTYQWIKNGVNVSSTVTPAPPAYVLATTSYSSGDVVYCTVTTNQGCYNPTATSNSMTITTTAPVTFTAGAGPSGGISYCQGAPVTLVASGNETVTSYQWSQNGSAISGATGSTYPTTATSVSQLQSYSVTLTTGAGCLNNTTATGTTASVPFTVTPTVGVPTAPSGSTTRCEGSGTGTYTTSATNATAYNWTISPATAGTIAGTSTTGTVTWSATYTGTAVISVTASGCNGPSAAASTNVIVSSPAVPAVSIAATASTICTGTSVTFTATPTNGGSTPAYQWQVNGSNVGTNSSTYSTTTLTNSQVVSCVMTTSATCITTATASSNAITMTVTALQSMTVSITGTLPVCTSNATSFVANVGNAGTGTLTYQWKKNGVNVSSTVTPTPPAYVLATTSYSSGDVVYCTVTTNQSCYNPTATSNSMTITTTAPVTFTAGAGPSGGISYCQGDSVTLVATGNETVTSYQWALNGSNITGATGSTLKTTAVSVSQLQSYSVVLTTGAGCLNNTTATGTTASVPFTVTPTVGVPTAPTGPTARCESAGTGTYTTSATNATAYNWTISPAAAGTITGASTTGTVTWSATYTGTATISVTASGCHGPSAASSTAVTVGPPVQSMTLSITGTLPVCTSGATSFIANVGNAGTGTLTYQWIKNGVNVSSTVTPAPPAYVLATTSYSSGDVVYCTVTTNQSCYNPTATSNSMTITTTTPVTFTVGAGPITGIFYCPGDSVKFTASGNEPLNSYQWSQNGSAIPGMTGDTLRTTAISIAQLHSYSVTATTAGGCLANTTATGTTSLIPFTISPPSPASVSIADAFSTVGSLTTYTFTATPVMGGTSPKYQWQMNGINIPSATGSTYSATSTAIKGNSIGVILTSSDGCASPSVVCQSLNMNW